MGVMGSGGKRRSWSSCMQNPMSLTVTAPRNMANILVDRSRPGDFNQALMELGATVCTPKSPLCGECPVKEHCHAWHRVACVRAVSSASVAALVF